MSNGLIMLSSGQKKADYISNQPLIECPGQESNLHALRHTHLKRARLPIPPPGHFGIAGAKVVKKLQPASILQKKSQKYGFVSSSGLLIQVFVVENQQIDHRNRDITVREVEDRTEEVVVAIHQEREPLRTTVPLEEGEVEHIDHLAHHKAGIRATEMGHAHRRRGREAEAIEGRVEDVAHCACQDQRQADQHALGGLLKAIQVVDQVGDTARGRNTEQAQNQLTPIVAVARHQTHAERGTRIFDEAQLKPIGKDRDPLSEREVGLDPNLKHLVGNQQHNNQPCEIFQIHFHGHKISAK